MNIDTQFTAGFRLASQAHRSGVRAARILAYVRPLYCNTERDGIAAYVDVTLGYQTELAARAQKLGLR
jgi:hypothetical protein